MIFKPSYPFLLILSLLGVIIIVNAQQNLVPNGSFEENTGYPTDFGQWYKAIGWTNVNGSYSVGYAGSPDYYHTNGSGGLKLPNALAGIVYPVTGNAVMGLYTYADFENNWREYISADLNCPIRKGSLYNLSFFITNGKKSYHSLASNNIGIHFSNTPLTQTTWNPINVIPQIEIDTIIADSNWLFLSFQFLATDNYSYITIGNFRNDATTQTKPFNPLSTKQSAYYFLEDFELKIDSSILQISYCNDTICEGDTITIFATNNKNITWFKSNDYSDTLSTDQNLTISPSVSTTYIVKNTTESDTITIVVNPKPAVNLGNDTLVCSGSFVTLNAASPESTYLWNNNSSASSISILNPGTYWVDVTNSYGCTSRDSIEINLYPTPTINLGNDTSLCDGDSLLLDANYSEASYLWQDGTANSSFMVNSPGAYWVKLTDSICSFTDTINIAYINQASINLGNDTLLCAGKSLLLNVSVPGGTYLWQNGSVLPSYNVTTPGTYWVRVTANSCSSFDSVYVAYRPNPVVSLGNDTSLCAGDSLVLDVYAPGLTYLWNGGITSASYTAFSSGNYTVTVSDSLCSGSDSRIVNFNNYPLVELGNDTSICGDSPFVISDKSDTCSVCTYLWQDGSVFKSFTAGETGKYKVEVTSLGCTSSDSIDITFYDYPVISLGNDTALCPEESYLITVNSDNCITCTYLWNDGSFLPELNVSEKGNYSVIVTQNNCYSSDSMLVGIVDCDLNIPNVITPNEDGVNDKFIITGNASPLQVSIYNRWGKQVFNSPSYLNNWDAKGLNDGVYFYIVTNVNSGAVYNGTVQVLR